MKTGNKNIIKSIAQVLTSNITTILSGIVIGFIIPKVISVEGYGFYKTFTLYVTYTGMFSMGIIDGIVLDYGGCDYESLDCRLFRSIFKWYILIHVIWIVVILATTIFIQDANYSFIVAMIAIYMFFANIVGYFQQISQITQRFKEYSVAKIIQSAMKIIGGVIMIGIYYLTQDYVNYRIYIGLSTLGFIIIAIGYTIIYRELIFGVSFQFFCTGKIVLHLSKIGFPLMFANLCGTFILTLDRQFVNLLFTNSEYAVYAFAYNLLSLITVATSAVSTVLYPMLKRTQLEALEKKYSDLVSTILIFVFGAMLVYFPLSAFIQWFLPKYTESLVIFRVIFPGLAISSAITVVMHNYYKILGDNFIYFKRSILILLLSAVANGIAYVLFKTTISISMASIVSMTIWYLYIEQYFMKKFQCSRKKNLVYMLLMMGVFYLITFIPNWIISGVLYFLAYGSVTLLIQRDTLLFAKGFIRGK